MKRSTKVCLAIQALLLITKLNIQGQMKGRSAVMNKIAEDSAPKKKSFYINCNAPSSVYCAQECLASDDCVYLAVRQKKFDSRYYRCRFYNKKAMVKGLRRDRDWTLFEKMPTTTEHESTKETNAKRNNSKAMGNVFRFPTSNVANYVNFSMASMPNLSEFTICMKFRTTKNDAALFGYWAPGMSCDQITITTENVKIKNTHVAYRKVLNGWRRLCISSSNPPRTVIYFNGVEIKSKRGSSRSIEVTGGGYVILGQQYKNRCQKKEFDNSRSFAGDIKDIEMWGRTLSSNHIEHRSRSGRPDLISWDVFKRNAELIGNVNLV
eukprot:gene4532-5129_t